MRSLVVFVFCVCATCLAGQSNEPGILIRSFDTEADPVTFTLVKGSRERTVRLNHDLKVYFERTTSLGSGRSYLLKYHVRGANLGLSHDSLSISSPQVYIHDEYKRNTDSIYDYFKNTKSGISRMPVSSITSIHYERSKLKQVTIGVGILSLAAAFVVAPAVALEDGKLNLEKFRQINRPALGVLLGSATIGLVFSQKRMHLKSARSAKSTWSLKPTP